MSDVAAPLKWALFTSATPGGPPGVLWDHPLNRDFDYLDLNAWISVAHKLEEACFDVIFWADHSGVHDVYQGSWSTAVREAVQFPSLDPIVLAAALASSTSDLGFAFSANVIQDHPYAFARKLATIDHLTNGRAAWNIVTSFQPSAWRNLGYDQVGSHSERYGRAQEYMDVVYQLLEGSWAADAVVRDTARRVYARPERVRDINHDGERYRVPGIQPTEPSPQRVPVLFQAGGSDEGRAFAAAHAEAIFFAPPSPDVGVRAVEDVRARAVASGRNADDLIFFLHESVVIGSTEEEARRKDAELAEYLSSETNLAFSSSTLGADFSTVDLDQPIGNFQTDSLQGTLRGLMEKAKDKSLSFRQVVMNLTSKRFVGTPEQFADHVGQWSHAGVGGVNVGMATGTRDIDTFVAHVVPVLSERGLIQRQYAPGTLREKLFGAGPRLNDRHPAASVRWPD